MKIINQSVLVNDLPRTWREHYPPGANHTTPDKEDIYRRLFDAQARSLLTAELAAQIIGNDAWVTVTCDECGELCESAVRLGWDVDWERDWSPEVKESDFPMICLPCLKKAVALLERKSKPSTMPAIASPVLAEEFIH